MPTRRQEKVARVIKEAVSDVIINHLNDPRITGQSSPASVTNDNRQTIQRAEFNMTIPDGTPEGVRQGIVNVLLDAQRVNGVNRGVTAFIA